MHWLMLFQHWSNFDKTGSTLQPRWVEALHFPRGQLKECMMGPQGLMPQELTVITDATHNIYYEMSAKHPLNDGISQHV